MCAAAKTTFLMIKRPVDSEIDRAFYPLWGGRFGVLRIGSYGDPHQTYDGDDCLLTAIHIGWGKLSVASTGHDGLACKRIIERRGRV
jgi:hypothetical protein